jgi:hypothetical protein
MESLERARIEHRLDAEGADFLLLAGVNDANLHELAGRFGIRVVLRGDQVDPRSRQVTRGSASLYPEVEGSSPQSRPGRLRTWSRYGIKTS